MAKATIKQLLEAGVHFGHQTQRWNPKMKKFIFGERNGIYIINLEITVKYLDAALKYVKELAETGAEVLFVGTKKQAQDSLRDSAESCKMPYVDQRWLGGTLTNFETIRKSISRLDEIDKMEQEGNFQFMKKKEVLMLTREREKLLKNLRGIRKMKRLPGALFIIDSKKEEIAIREAIKLGIPVVSIVDTNCDPDLVDHPIPGNDDAIRAIKLFCSLVSKSIIEGREAFTKTQPIEEKTEESTQEEVVAEAAEEKSAPAPKAEKESAPTEDASANEASEEGPADEEPADSKEEQLAAPFESDEEEDEEDKSKTKKLAKKGR